MLAHMRRSRTSRAAVRGPAAPPCIPRGAVRGPAAPPRIPRGAARMPAAARRRRLAAAAVSMLALLLTTAAHAPRARIPADDRAAILYRESQLRLAENSVEGRQAAIGELEEALRLAPDRIDYLIALGQAQNHCGYYELAHALFARAARL